MNVHQFLSGRSNCQDEPMVESDPVGQALAALTSASRNLVKVIAAAIDDNPELIDQIAHEAESEIVRSVMNEAAWVATLIETRMIANVALGRK